MHPSVFSSSVECKPIRSNKYKKRKQLTRAIILYYLSISQKLTDTQGRNESQHDSPRIKRQMLSRDIEFNERVAYI